jgi:hypothetical protein
LASINCSTSRCSFTTTSWRMTTLRLISIGFSGVLTLMQPLVATASAALVAAMIHCLLVMARFLFISRGSAAWR